jgi:hypothetical protein
MKSSVLITIGILILVVGILYAGGVIPHGTAGDIPLGASSTKTPYVTAEYTFESVLIGTTEQGDVALELTPTKMNDGTLSVDVSANTHSVDLSSFDLMNIILLEYGGKKITPLSAPQLNGHHTYGTVVFDVDDFETTSFTIIVENIPQIEQRVFRWER